MVIDGQWWQMIQLWISPVDSVTTNSDCIDYDYIWLMRFIVVNDD